MEVAIPRMAPGQGLQLVARTDRNSLRDRRCELLGRNGDVV